jgi:hypothetical protein
MNESLLEPTDLETDVYGRLHTMLCAAWRRRVSLRLVSLKLANIYDGRFRSELALEVCAQRLLQTVDRFGRYVMGVKYSSVLRCAAQT